MRLIADSGSTKTDWRFISPDKKIQQFVTDGINPNYQSQSEIIEIIGQLELTETPSEIFFYGAGCSSENNKQIILKAINHVFAKTVVQVESDMLAACRSLCGTQQGVVCILGTGSNACYYDGKSITEGTPALGYVLGDFGSGNILGRKLLHDFFGKRMDLESHKLFESAYSITLNDVLEKTYQHKRSAAYLATFANFIGAHLDKPYFYSLVYNSFREFFENDVSFLKLDKGIPVHFTGSIAFYFANILRKVGGDLNIHVKNIVQSPIAGLTLYHQFS